MRYIKARGVPVVVYQSTLDAPDFYGRALSAADFSEVAPAAVRMVGSPAGAR